MAYDLREGQGSLFKNERKETDKHPDYNGSIKLPDGTEHWLSAWIKQGAKGKFMSVQIGKPKTLPAARTDGNSVQPRTSRKSSAEMDDEIPF